MQPDWVLRAIAVSSLPSYSHEDRRAAFAVLEEFKTNFSGRVPLALEWLYAAGHHFEQHDITVATKLLALEVCAAFLTKGYAGLGETDRLAFRQAVLKASRRLCETTSQHSSNNNNSLPQSATRILARKLAALLEGIIIRDFPQRWPTLMTDIFTPFRQGGLLYDEPSTQSGKHVGVKICLEALKLLAEDCTDSDFNAKISTSRRNDVLKGLNEVSGHFLPVLFQFLEHYPLLEEAKTALYNMHVYIRNNQQQQQPNNTTLTIHNMPQEQRLQYQQQVDLSEELSLLIADTLVTLQRFCFSMPLHWMTGQQQTNDNPTETRPNFITPFLFLLREHESNIQLRAAECLEQLVLRGKLSYTEWLSLLRQLPAAVQQANQVYTTIQEQQTARAAARGDLSQPPLDPLAAQLDFHKSLSRLLALTLSSYISHISSSTAILSKQGEDYDTLVQFLRVVLDLAHHPSGRIITEQVNTWTTLLRDPNIAMVRLLQPFLGEIVTILLEHMVKIRWDDVEQGTHPRTAVMEASYEDEDDYDGWSADFRSRSSLLFKLSGHSEPAVVAQVLLTRVQHLMTVYGTGEPRDFLEVSNGQLTPKSEAVMQFEGLSQPLENTLSGMPSWAFTDQIAAANEGSKPQMREAVKEALSKVAQALVGWSPTDLWLKFRRASILEGLKYFWKYEPKTLLPAIETLLQNLGLPDEWCAKAPANERTLQSVEIVGLKKKSGVTLVSVSKKVPHHLVPWLTQLSEATGRLLSSSGLIPTNQMHLYEFLSCVATAVEDPAARAGFISNVLTGSIETLESNQVQQAIATVPSFLTTLGVSQVASNPALATDPENVKLVLSQYHSMFTALNQLLSVGRRCHEASRKRGMPGIADQAASTTNNFSDEGPVSINELAVHDPFVPLWPRILPSLLQMTRTVLEVWLPLNQATFLANPYQKFLYAISEDEAFISKTHDAKSGGVFGAGGTAGSVVSGASRRDVNLVPKWSGWMSELRNTCFQMIGLFIAQRALFAPELASFFPQVVSVLVDPKTLQSMEHRHFIQFQKHIVEILMTSCPPSLYKSHLEPILGPILEHCRFRLEKNWAPVLSSESTLIINGRIPPPTQALTSARCSEAAALASRGGEEYYSWYYAHGGLFVGDLDPVTAESAVEKSRVELGRTFSDMLQVVLALKGDWALVLANLAKEEAASKRADAPNKVVAGPRGRFADDGVQLNADGTPRKLHQAAADARKVVRINALCHFLLLESERVAGSLTLSVVQCLGYPDAYTCRRITKICHRILETVAWSPQYSELLGERMLTQAIRNVVLEPKWMVGIEWDMINVIRDIYCRLVLGQALQFGGQGAGQQQNYVDSTESSFEQSKAVDQPLQGGGILVVPSDFARRVFLSLPGVSLPMLQEFESKLKAKRSGKDQKDVIRDLLRYASDRFSEMSPTSVAGGAAAGLFDRAVQEESLLHTYSVQKAVPDIPEKLVLHSEVVKRDTSGADEPRNLSLGLFP